MRRTAPVTVREASATACALRDLTCQLAARADHDGHGRLLVVGRLDTDEYEQAEQKERTRTKAEPSRLVGLPVETIAREVSHRGVRCRYPEARGDAADAIEVGDGRGEMLVKLSAMVYSEVE